jgi:anti-anti-sigma factor
MLRVRIQPLGDVTVFCCSGGLTFGHSETLRNAVLTHLRTRKAVLDLAEVSSVDASGLGALLSLRAWTQEVGMTLKLMNLTPRVARLLEITQLRSAFEVCSAREMLDLLCRAMRQAESVATPPTFEIYGPRADARDLPSGHAYMTV